MTPKEKAEELVDKYICNPVVYHCKNGCITIDCMDMDSIKRCVLITIDEVINSHKNTYWINNKAVEFYLEVKNQIEKL